MSNYDSIKKTREYAIGLLFLKPPVFSENLRVGQNRKIYSRLRPKLRQYLEHKIDENLSDRNIALLFGVSLATIKRMFYKIREFYEKGF